MAVVRFSETYRKFGMTSDKLYVNQMDKFVHECCLTQVQLQICNMTPWLVLVHHLYVNLTLEAFESILQS